VPAQQRRGPHWYQGSADAIYQSLNLVSDDRPDYIVVFGADNIYRMDIRAMLDAHIASGASATVAGIRVPRASASEFGIIDAGTNGMIRSFLEKPKAPPGLPDSPDESLASMGNYIFTRSALVEMLHGDATAEDSKHDMGGDIIPGFVAAGECGFYDFHDNDVPGSTETDRDYWRDVGTIDAFHEANMDLVRVVPDFNLYNDRWPIWTNHIQQPGAKFTLNGNAESSIVCSGSIISGADVDHSVLSPGVRVDKGSSVDGCVLMDRVRVGENCMLRQVIVDKDVVVADGVQLGINREQDVARGCTVTEAGITVVPKGLVVAPA